MTPQIHTRTQAAELGLAKYWTGKACRRGHLDFRYTGTGACTSCVAGYRTKYITTKNAARGKGAVPFTALLHPADVHVVQELVDALAFARTLTP